MYRAATTDENRCMFVIRLLGPMTVEKDGAAKPITAPLQRALLAALTLARGHSMSRDQLVTALWRDPPPRVANVVQQYVSALRRALGQDAVTTLTAGYRLNVDSDEVDVVVFRRLATLGEQRRHEGDLDGALRALQESLDQWRGAALEDLPDCPFVEQSSTVLAHERT